MRIDTLPRLIIAASVAAQLAGPGARPAAAHVDQTIDAGGPSLAQRSAPAADRVERWYEELAELSPFSLDTINGSLYEAPEVEWNFRSGVVSLWEEEVSTYRIFRYGRGVRIAIPYLTEDGEGVGHFRLVRTPEGFAMRGIERLVDDLDNRYWARAGLDLEFIATAPGSD